MRHEKNGVFQDDVQGRTLLIFFYSLSVNGADNWNSNDLNAAVGNVAGGTV